MSRHALGWSWPALLLLLPMLSSCDTTQEPLWENLPPRSEITSPEDPSGTLIVDDGERITLRWRSVDPEEQIGMVGGIVAVRIRLDGADPIVLECPPDHGEWWFSSSAQSGSSHHISSVNLPTGGNVAHRFTVCAQDVRGTWEPESEGAFYAFRYNHPPSSEIVYPQDGESLGTSFTIAWEGNDVDGDVAEYQYVVDPAQGSWEVTQSSSLSCAGVEPGEHEFRLRARDSSGCWEETYNVVTFDVR
jgi:hypothetical protein